MTKFALRKMSSIGGYQTFYKLCVDNKCLFDEFEARLKNSKSLKNELAKIYAYMELIARGISLPTTKFKDITPKKQIIKEYECR